MKRLSVIEQFVRMTADQHTQMKDRLLAMAKSGKSRPKANTLEGYALIQYATPR